MATKPPAPAPSTRPTLTTKNPTTTTTTSSFIETLSTSNVDGSTQTSINPSATNSTIHNPILGDPSLEGAYKFIGIILIYSVVFLVCFIIFAILTYRAIKTKTDTSPDPGIRLNTIRKKQKTNIFKPLENDKDSVSSRKAFAGIDFPMPSASKRRASQDHKIRCYPENSAPDFNRDYDNTSTHEMYIQTRSSPVPSLTRSSSTDIIPSSFRKDERPHKVPNHSNEETEYDTQDKPIALFQDDGHCYTLRKKPTKPPPGQGDRDRDQDWIKGYQG